ncbi:putative beta-glucosidase I [Venturia nashicola]|uniref:Serine/threonine-protein kinase n=1 Tax=Venturia nashicola TaxID=86259 RepID=A0A4Z1NNV9_9PEZI|nr:putative beta-glucosidase I [Venturia nashicola]
MSMLADPPPAIVQEPKDIQYITGDKLGNGGFAICYRGELCQKSKPTGKIIALKIVKSQMDRRFITELQLHSKLSHPNIVEFHRAFSFGECTYVVLELCHNGSLADALRKRKFFTMPEIRRFIIQTCGAVKYLHGRNIVHRDLKTGNIFLDKGMNVKVGDFGLAAVLVSKHDIGMRRTTMCGTPNYLAPEILEKTGHNEKVDLWAVGIIAYTLAVGKAPFHASNKEEIYKKARKGEYEWPDVSKHQNDISNDLRDLVSSLLVHEDERPSPDQIVSHAFFKTNFVPETLESSCTTRKPIFPSIKPPSAETIRRGYSDSWLKVCKQSGVGEYAPGKTFPLQAKKLVSVVKDCEKEMAAGRAPMVPIPEGTVYLPFPERVNILEGRLNQLSEISEERDSSGEGRQLTEINPSDRSNKSVPRSMGPPPPRHHLQENVDPLQALMAPPAAIKRTNSRKKRPEAEAERRPSASRQLPLEQPAPAQPRPRPTSLRHAPRVEAEGVDAGRVELPAPEIGVKPSSRQTSREQPAESIPRPRSIQHLPQEEIERKDFVESKPLILREPTRRERPARTQTGFSRSRQASQEEALTHAEALSRPSPPLVSAPPLRRARSVRTVSADEANAKKQAAIDVISIPDDSPSESEENSIPDTSFTDPTLVLARAAKLRDNIASALAGKSSLPRRASTPPKLPFVSKWVDYARKHGVGYVLEDGSVGCLFNATSKHLVTHVVVNNGYSHLMSVGGDLEAVGRVPLEFYSHLENNEVVNRPVETDRKRQTMILWAKFGKYMCQNLGEQQKQIRPQNHKDGSLFMRYYQRLGSVGIWGFSNGCFQFNFPDHTKLVLSSDGRFCNFTCLSPQAMSHLHEHNELPFKFIKTRNVLSGTLDSLLYGDTKMVAITEANLLREKLGFVADVVGQWVKAGGLGRSPDSRVQRIPWTGPRLEDGKKEEWITVGRFGGDSRA